MAAAVVAAVDQYIADAGCAHVAEGDFFAGGSTSLHICRERPSVPKPQKIVDLTLSPAMIFSCERINAGIDADVANKEIRTLDKMGYLVIRSLAENNMR